MRSLKLVNPSRIAECWHRAFAGVGNRERAEERSRPKVPEPQIAVVRAGEYMASVEANPYGKDHAVVTYQGAKEPAGLQIPDPQCPVA